MEGVVGNGFRGDIAIDDVSIATGACQAATSTTDPVSCNFEDSGMCQYTQDTTDQFNWNRKTQGTSTVGSGPASDHTYGTAAGMASQFCSFS